MSYVLTGAVRLSGTYVDENGAERQYVVTRGQNVTALGLPHSVVQELIGKTRPLGGRRGTPIPYFTKVDDIPVPSTEDRNVSVQSLNEGIHKGRVEAGVIEPDAEYEKELPQPPAEPDEPLDKFARTPEEAEAAATADAPVEEEVVAEPEVEEAPAEEVVEESVEEPASEPVVSPDEEVVDEATCAKPDCAVAGDVASCEDDACPVNEAPVEEGSVEDAEPVAEIAETREPAVEDAKVEEKPAAKKPQGKKSGGKKGGSKKSGKSSK